MAGAYFTFTTTNTNNQIQTITVNNPTTVAPGVTQGNYLISQGDIAYVYNGQPYYITNMSNQSNGCADGVYQITNNSRSYVDSNTALNVIIDYDSKYSVTVQMCPSLGYYKTGG